MRFFNFRKETDFSVAHVNLALDILGIVYLHPVKTAMKTSLMFAGVFLLFTYFHYYLIYLQILHINGDISLLSRTVASFSTYTQASLKMLPIIYYHDHITNLLHKRKNFWPNDTGKTADIKDINTLLENAFHFSRFFCVMVALTALMYFLKPIFIKELFIILWVPDYPYAFEVLLFGQYVYCPLLCCMIVGTDVLFVSLCVDMIVQFKILGLNIQRIVARAKANRTSDMGELRRCIEHHVFLLEYVNDIEKLFRFPLLGEYLITIGSTCMELYTLTDPNSSINNKMISFMYSSSLLFQFGLFCFPASSLSEFMMNVSDDFYFSNWEDGSAKMCKCISFNIMRAQKDFSLKAGGMLHINKEAYTNVFKTAFSFLTLMRSLQE